MKNIVMTGVTSGFGINYFLALDKTESATFYLLARDQKKVAKLKAQHQFNNPVIFIDCQLDSFNSIKNAVATIKQHTNSLDILINNAGIWASDKISYSQDGIEATLAVNHLAPYLLTGLLLPLLKNSGHATVVNTASFMHFIARVKKHDIGLIKHYSDLFAYSNAKLFNILFTQKLADLVANNNISVHCFDPGIVDTVMLKQGFPRLLLFLYPLFRRYFARSPEQGAATGIFLAKLNNQQLSGNYWRNNKITFRRSAAKSDQLATWLWQESERLTGFNYDL